MYDNNVAVWRSIFSILFVSHLQNGNGPIRDQGFAKEKFLNEREFSPFSLPFPKLYYTIRNNSQFTISLHEILLATITRFLSFQLMRLSKRDRNISFFFSQEIAHGIGHGRASNRFYRLQKLGWGEGRRRRRRERNGKQLTEERRFDTD